MSFLAPDRASVRRRRLFVGGSAVALTGIVMTAFLLESRSGYLPPDPKIIYVQSWAGDRTREQAIADRDATLAAREAKLFEARRYIATLSGKARTDAQKQYDAYVAGDGGREEIPYVAASRP